MENYNWKNIRDNGAKAIQTVFANLGVLAILHFIIWYWGIPTEWLTFEIVSLYYKIPVTIFQFWIIYEATYWLIRVVHRLFERWRIRERDKGFKRQENRMETYDLLKGLVNSIYIFPPTWNNHEQLIRECEASRTIKINVDSDLLAAAIKRIR